MIQQIEFTLFSSEIVFFLCIILVSIGIDVYISKKESCSEEKKFVTNSLFSLGWIIFALLFNLYIYLKYGPKQGLEFFTGYLIEKSLSIDNLFLFILIFKEFKVPPSLQHRTLFYGMFGAIVFRLMMIFLGGELLAHFSWVVYIFGIFLIFAGYKACQPSHHSSLSLGKKWIGFFQSYFPITSEFHGEHFFIHEKNRKWVMTPLFLALIAIEFSDIIFAIDSIPAILSITQDKYIVLTSNIFAILGLRSLYFVIQPLLTLFSYLQYAIGCILIFVGIKFLISPLYHISTPVSLFFIISTLATAIAISCRATKE